MSPKFQRSFRNYLINKSFQIKFLLRFFFFTLFVLTIGGAIQYFISNKTILQELAKQNEELTSRKSNMESFLQNYKYGLDYKMEKVDPRVLSFMEHTVSGYNNFLQKEIEFMNQQIKHINIVLAANKKDLVSAFWGSLILVGLLVNILLALIYGVFLSHRFAGNHYRLQQFAKQLQDRDFASQLIIRRKDFFQETAVELDKARQIVQTDLQKVKSGNQDILNSYKV